MLKCVLVFPGLRHASQMESDRVASKVVACRSGMREMVGPLQRKLLQCRSLGDLASCGGMIEQANSESLSRLTWMFWMPHAAAPSACVTGQLPSDFLLVRNAAPGFAHAMHGLACLAT